MNESAKYLAYDVGGSHATAGIVHLAPLRVHHVRSCPIDSAGSRETILNQLHALGVDVLSESNGLHAKPDGIALAMPGPFDYERGISLLRHKYASLYSTDVRGELGGRFGVSGERIAFMNDAQAYLLGECQAGAGKGLHRCIGLTLGTGIGSAFFNNGDIIEQGAGVPPGGEIYCLPWKGATVEDAISTRAIQSSYLKLTGIQKSVKDICALVPSDPVAQQVICEFGNELGLVLKGLCVEFRPEAVIFGGAISKSADLFLPAVMRSVGQVSEGMLRKSQLWEDAPLLGAAARCIERLMRVSRSANIPEPEAEIGESLHLPGLESTPGAS